VSVGDGVFVGLGVSVGRGIRVGEGTAVGGTVAVGVGVGAGVHVTVAVGGASVAVAVVAVGVDAGAEGGVEPPPVPHAGSRTAKANRQVHRPNGRFGIVVALRTHTNDLLCPPRPYPET
jgi:hypothetical protein